ncbi:hypothetical protein KEG38_24005 [Polyangium jinanense]|uniref:phospholipase D-like domain-containing protein n=1 Tax=Polyangium jinanense TaxID=2829994 RepID=UPI002340B986|nr:phospholipase D-like domain-containing protein [Polyangium jinanense]MDC3956946.1 hypothetical protein [Polyangium jinanense]
MTNPTSHTVARADLPTRQETLYTPAQAQVAAAGAYWVKAPKLVSDVTYKNKVTYLVDGKMAMGEIAKGIIEAKTSIWMAGWALDMGCRLQRDEGSNRSLRDLLMGAASKPTFQQLYILLWDGINNIPYNLNDEKFEKDVEEMLPAEPKELRHKTRVLRHRPGRGWAHHGKFIIIDGNIGFLGGIDLFEGRWDTDDHPLTSLETPSPYDAYNPCRADHKDESKRHRIPRMPWHDIHLRIEGPAVGHLARHFAQRWAHHNRVHALMNVAKPSLTDAVRAIEDLGDAIEDRDPAQVGKIDPPTDYVLRGVEYGFATDVEPELPAPEKIPIPGPVQGGAQAVQIVRSLSKESGTSGETERTIYDAYKQAISSAEHYIYIENQFFLSRIAPTSVDFPYFTWKLFGPVENEIVDTLVARIEKMAKTPSRRFHVYVMLPVHPEGVLHGVLLQVEGVRKRIEQIMALRRSIATIIEATKAYVANATPELLKTAASAVKRGYETVRIKVKELSEKLKDLIVKYTPDFIKKPLTDIRDWLVEWWKETPNLLEIIAKRLADLGLTLDQLKNILDIYFSSTHGILVLQLQTIRDLIERVKKVTGGDHRKYLSFYCLRNHGKLDNVPVTEQIYVHSKMMLVDDRVFIVGSANINDRSLLGDRDSEVSAIVVDEATSTTPMGGKPTVTRNLARKLRMELWKEHFKVDVEDPIGGDGETIEQLRAIATENSRIYSEVFWNMPADTMAMLPLVSTGPLGSGEGGKPLSVDIKNFSVVPEYKRNGTVAMLDGIKGHAVLLPERWLEKETLNAIEQAFSKLLARLERGETSMPT